MTRIAAHEKVVMFVRGQTHFRGLFVFLSILEISLNSAVYLFACGLDFMAEREVTEASFLAHHMAEATTYTIIQADGLYPDSNLEDELFAPSASQNYNVRYLQTYLWPPGTVTAKPWSAIPDEIRNEVDGIMVLKMRFTEQDLQLFPRLKV